MVDLAEIQAAYYMVAATGVLVAAVFYILNLRVSQRNMKVTLETRQAQFWMQLSLTITEENIEKFIEMMKWDWKDYENFEQKYGTENNPKAAAQRLKLWTSFDLIGLYLRQGLLDREVVYRQMGSYVLWVGMKFGDVMKEWEKAYRLTGTLDDFFYLYGEMGKMRGGVSAPAETFMSYVKK